MAKCVKCGAELIEGARFCRECGTKVEVPVVTPEKAAAVKSEIEVAATGLRELADKMLATYVTGMKDLEDTAARIKEEAAAKAAEFEAALKEKSVLLDAKTREFNNLSEMYSKLQVINQQLQTERYDAQAKVAELNNKVTALEQAKASLMAALTAQQSVAPVPAAPVVQVVQQPAAVVPQYNPPVDVPVQAVPEASRNDMYKEEQ